MSENLPESLPQESQAPSEPQPPLPPPESQNPQDAAALPPPATPGPVISKVPRPSGLKPPTKLGRPCCLSTPKPAVPPSPKSTTKSSESARRYSDDYSRKHLADLLEADEELQESLQRNSDIIASFESHYRERKPSTCSTYSITSMDALWERHPRRLSEAGLRRTSDHSVVLTEDTDSFIIGERVWVGGSKPGQIAYIGDTKFAPGEWAGIVLDEPIGKNDGSVAGVRYFQCEARKGVFSRLTRLTREPLAFPSPSSPAPSDISFSRPPSVPYEGSSKANSPAPPPSTVRSSISRIRPRASSPNGSMKSFTSRLSTSTYAGPELKLGDRVIVSSSQGSKAGILRYTGPTEFAPGQWCGVELDEPIGKNDGSVEGKRYFECSPRFGLFAPASKVSRSPSNRRPGNCAVHGSSRMSSPPDSITPSIASSMTSAIGRPRLGVTSLAGGAQRMSGSGPRAVSTPMSTKNVLQELLREKQVHIERLIHEQDVEKGEWEKVSIKLQRTEQSLAASQKENTQLTKDLAAIKSQLETVTRELDDEKQKVEDLQFKSEEDNIHKEDAVRFKDELANEKTKLSKEIEDLKEQLINSNKQIDELQGNYNLALAQHEAESNITNMQHKDELDASQALANQLQTLLNEAHALLREKEGHKESLGKNHNEELSKVRLESEKQIQEWKCKLVEVEQHANNKISELEANLKVSEEKLAAQNDKLNQVTTESQQTIDNIKQQLGEKQSMIENKIVEVNQYVAKINELELIHKKEIDKLKMELSSKIMDSEESSDNAKKLQNTIEEYEKKLKVMEENLSAKESELSSLKSTDSDTKSKHVAEIKLLQDSINEKELQVKDLTINVEQLNNIIHQENEKSTEVSKKNADIQVTLEGKLESVQKDNESLQSEISKLNSTISNQTEEISTFRRDIGSKVEKIKQIEDKLTEVTNLDAEKSAVVDKLNREINQLRENIDSANENLKASIEKYNIIELENGEIQRKLRDTLEENSNLISLKEKLETELQEAGNHSSDSNQQLENLQTKLKNAEKNIQETKDLYKGKMNALEANEQVLKQSIDRLNSEFVKEKESLELKIKQQIEINENYQKEIDTMKEVQQHKNDEYTQSILNLENKYNEEKNNLEAIIMSQNTKESKLEEEYNLIKNKYVTEVEELKKHIKNIQDTGQSSESKFQQEVIELNIKNQELKKNLEDSIKNEKVAKESLVSEIEQKVTEIKLLETQINDLHHQTTKSNDELLAIKNELETNKNQVEIKNEEFKDLTLKLSMLELEVKSNVDIISEKSKQIDNLNVQLKNFIDEKQQYEKQIDCLQSNEKLSLEKVKTISENHENALKKITEYESKIHNLELQLDTENKEKTSSIGLLQELSTKEKHLVDKCEESDRIIKNLNNEIEIFKNELNLKSNDIIEKEKKLAQFNELQKSNEANSILISDLKNNLKTKETNLSELALKLSNTEKILENLTNNESQLQSVYTKLESEKADCVKEISELKKFNESLNKKCGDFEKQLQGLDITNEKIKELTTRLETSDLDVKKLNEINDAQKKNFEDLNTQLKNEYDKLKHDSKKDKKALKSQIEIYKSDIETANKQLSSEKESTQTLEKKCGELTSTIGDLEGEVRCLKACTQEKSDQEADEIKKLVLELQSLETLRIQEKKSMGEKITTLTELVTKKETESTKYDKQISLLEEELKKKSDELIETQREMQLLKNSKNSATDKNSNIQLNENSQTKRLIEEKEEVEGQVSFLNSVIIDMQRKNDELKARVEVLEMGFTAQEAEQFNFGSLKIKTVAPRMFCDICDIFDAHETEDCPRQTMEEPPPAQSTESSSGSSKKKPPAPRPYCDMCEVFGHNTEDCNEDETY